MKTILKATFAAGCLAALCAYALEPSGKLFENADVNVARALEKTHVKGAFHQHKMNRVMVYMQGGKQRFEYQDGRKPVVRDWKAGQVVWSAPEGMHAGEVLTDESFNIVEIELKKSEGGSSAVGAKDPLKVDAKQYKLEFENPQVRVMRLRLAAHQSTPMVESTRNAVAAFPDDQELRITDAAGKTETVKHKTGDAAWETPGTRKIENMGAAPIEVIVVELK